MNLLSLSERDGYLKSLEKELSGKKIKNTEIILCPPFVHLEAFKNWKDKKIHPRTKSLLANSSDKRGGCFGVGVKIGAQNMFSEDKGSYTGEVSPVMLKNLGCEYVIIGHSERRRYFSENNEEINLKVAAALKNGIRPILCVGETKSEKENGLTLEVVGNQIRESLAGINRAKCEQIVVAYEPVWAVGSDVTPSANEIMEAKVLIRKILVEMFGERYAKSVSIIYGGSVNAKNAKEVSPDPGMDGALVGRDCLVAHEFIKIVEIISNEQ